MLTKTEVVLLKHLPVFDSLGNTNTVRIAKSRLGELIDTLEEMATGMTFYAEFNDSGEMARMILAKYEEEN